MSLEQCSVERIAKEGVVLHIFTSPETGELVNSEIIETENALVLVDVPLYKPFAEEHRAYVEGLGKPIARILITHAHPDHWFSLSYYKDHESYAFQEAIDEMAFLKDLAVGYHRSIHADLVPDEVSLPSNSIAEGAMIVDGLTLNLLKVLDAEATATMAVEIPAINTLIAQDLVYNHCYLYVATKTAAGDSTIDSWISHLETFKQRGYELVVPGHGSPTDSSIFDENIEYLTFAKSVLASASNGDDLVSQFKTRYPDYRLPLTLTMSAIMLYPPG